MTLDPNWFYSSLAQSAAAIVGIVGSVLVVRLQSQVEVARRSKEQFLRSFLECRTRWLAQVSHMNSLMIYVERMRPLVAQALENGATQLNVTEEIHFVGGQSGSPWPMPISPATLETFEHDKNAANLWGNALSALSKVQELYNLGSHFASLNTLRQNLPQELHHIVDPALNDASNDLRRLIEQITRHSVQTSIWTSVTLTAVLAWLCVFGLLVPLTYLSAYADVHKYGFTVAFAVAVLALPVVLALQVNEVRTTARLSLAPEDVLP